MNERNLAKSIMEKGSLKIIEYFNVLKLIQNRDFEAVS